MSEWRVVVLKIRCVPVLPLRREAVQCLLAVRATEILFQPTKRAKCSIVPVREMIRTRVINPRVLSWVQRQHEKSHKLRMSKMNWWWPLRSDSHEPQQSDMGSISSQLGATWFWFKPITLANTEVKIQGLFHSSRSPCTNQSCVLTTFYVWWDIIRTRDKTHFIFPEFAHELMMSWNVLAKQLRELDISSNWRRWISANSWPVFSIIPSREIFPSRGWYYTLFSAGDIRSDLAQMLQACSRN